MLAFHPQIVLLVGSVALASTTLPLQATVDVSLPKAVSVESATEKPSLKSPLNVFSTVVEDKKVPCFHHTFNSDIFKAYYEQLQEFIKIKLEVNPTFLERVSQDHKNTFYRQTLVLIGLMQLKLPAEAQLRRDCHEKILSSLRVLIQQTEKEKNRSELDQEVFTFINDISLWMYTGPDLSTPMQQLLEKISDVPFSDLNDQNMIAFFEKFFTSLKANAKLKHSYNPSQKFEDTHYFRSLPFPYMRLGQLN